MPNSEQIKRPKPKTGSENFPFFFLGEGMRVFGFQIGVCQRDAYPFHESNIPMGKGPHGAFLYATHYQFSWHIYAFLKVFGVLRTFLQKGSKPPEAVPL